MNAYVEGYLVYSDASKTTLLACSSAATGNIAIPNSVTSIGGNAFFGCSGLTSITIPNSVTSIGGNAFFGCSGLTSLTIPNSVMSIGYCAFYGCSGLTSIIIPNNVTSIGTCAFMGCTGLTSVVWNINNYPDCKNEDTPFCGHYYDSDNGYKNFYYCPIKVFRRGRH